MSVARLEEVFGPQTSALIMEAVREILAAEVEALRAAWTEALAEHERSEESEWIPAERAADLLGCTVRALYSRINRGTIPAAKVGRRLYVNRNDLDDLMSRHRRRRGT